MPFLRFCVIVGVYINLMLIQCLSLILISLHVKLFYENLNCASNWAASPVDHNVFHQPFVVQIC